MSSLLRALVTRIVSGGQTGVDRGALDGALNAGLSCGGWCPEGRIAEDGTIPLLYPVTELPGAGYRQRTRQNVLDSDGTLVIHFGPLTGGTRETVRFCEQLGKPVLVVDGEEIDAKSTASQTVSFLSTHSIKVLNVAGPRESSQSGAHDYAKTVVQILAQRLRTHLRDRPH